MSKELCIVPTGLPCLFKDAPAGLVMTLVEPFEFGIKNKYKKFSDNLDQSGGIWDPKGLVLPIWIQPEEDEA